MTDEQAKVINVLICDDHHFVRTGLADVLAGFPDLKVVGAAENGEQGVEMAVALEPDIVLMDISMPGIDGLEATRRVVEARPTSRVVMLTSYSGHERIVDALKAGAVGYLLKDAPPADIVRTIRSAASAVAVQPDI